MSSFPTHCSHSFALSSVTGASPEAGMFIFRNSVLSVLLLTHSPIFFSVLSGCVDNQYRSKYSIELFTVRAAASDNAPSSVAVSPPIDSIFKVLFVLRAVAI